MINKIRKLFSKEQRIINEIAREQEVLVKEQANRENIINRLMLETPTDVGITHDKEVKKSNTTISRIQIRLDNLEVAKESLETGQKEFAEQHKQMAGQNLDAEKAGYRLAEQRAVQVYKNMEAALLEQAEKMQVAKKEYMDSVRTSTTFGREYSVERILEIIRTNNFEGISPDVANALGLKEEYNKWMAERNEKIQKETKKARAEKAKIVQHKKDLYTEADRWMREHWLPFDMATGVDNPEVLVSMWTREKINPRTFYVFDKSLIRRKREAEPQEENKTIVQKGIEIIRRQVMA